MEFQAFVDTLLPSPPVRVLEVGCGGGELARAIARSGYEVVAIDPEAPLGPLFRPTRLEEFAEPGPFDVVIADRALHHISDLPAALDKIARLLGPTGRLVLNEHACDRLDEPTAQWLLGQRAKIDSGAARSLDECIAEWKEDHAGLHGYLAMREELDQRFTERFFAWRPYLYGELGGAVSETEEQTLIEAGAIQATGFRYVGERR